ncbi:SIR2 family protein [Betaproteobacteria bacterium]|nr:SIR2 family protein [Betaproteobacteria bacterium]
MNTHDPREHIRGIHQILISDKKRIGFLFGAGTSFATGIDNVFVPAIDEMTKIVITAVDEHSPEFKNAVKEIKAETTKSGISFNIESLLSNIEAKHTVIGAGNLNGLDANGFAELAKLVKKKVVDLVSVEQKLHVTERKEWAHAHLANWIQKAMRRFPAEIFTTNYDYFFEIALEKSGIPYFDGFSGSYEPFFCPEAVEDIDAYSHLVKLWKMHGSLGWTYRDLEKIVIRKQSTSEDSILIYPSHLKYNSSKKQPYVGLIDRLCAFLQQDDAVLFTCGYSFGDNHINERIVTSLRRGANSHVIAMYYDETRTEDRKRVFGLENETNEVRDLAAHKTGGKMSAYGLRHAVIGGKFGEWKLRDEPKATDLIHVSQYFDEDAATPSDEEGERKGDECWTGKGRFLLPDFRKLANFLNDLSLSEAPINTP